MFYKKENKDYTNQKITSLPLSLRLIIWKINPDIQIWVKFCDLYVNTGITFLADFTDFKNGENIIFYQFITHCYVAVITSWLVTFLKDWSIRSSFKPFPQPFHSVCELIVSRVAVGGGVTYNALKTLLWPCPVNALKIRSKLVSCFSCDL